MARRGIWTRLKDLNPEFVARGMKTVRKLVSSDVRRRRITSIEGMEALDHLSPTTDYRGLKNADLVLEAVLEEMDVKHKVFDELAAATGPECVLATNTSSLTVADIAQKVSHPERVVGLHFFNPPDKMPLVEVVRGPKSSPEAVAKAAALASRIGKTIVLVGDCAGFLVEPTARRLHERGGSPGDGSPRPARSRPGRHRIRDAHGSAGADRPRRSGCVEPRFGKHAGRLRRADGAGSPLEIPPQSRPRPRALRPKIFLESHLGRRLNPTVAKAIAEMARQAPPTQTMSHEAIAQRLVYPMINEAARCLDEKVVATADDVDLAMVFGTGFAPFRGGPLRYADSVGIPKIVETLDRLAPQHPRLAPCDALRRKAAAGECFHAAAD